MATINVKDAADAVVAIEKPLAPGRASEGSSRPVVLSTEDKASLDAAVTALQIVDDWDEGDRAKVNPIVGQAGVAAGAGSVSATTQRATLASDDPAVVALQIIDDWDETDRAKVNPIVGQAGVAAGAGSVSALTQRVTLASDDPAVAALGAVNGAAVVTDANGTIQQYLRGIVKLLITAGTVVLGAGTALIGKVDHASTGIGDGRTIVTTAGTAVALASSTAAKWVTIVAELDNTGVVTVGASTVVASLSTRRGFPLRAGETVTLPIDNLNDVSLDTTVNGDGVTYIYGT